MPIHSDDADGNTGTDLLLALARLQRGEPTHPKLVLAKRRGKLKINVSTVAREAGRSRTLIGHDGCAYPEVRSAVQAASEPQPDVSREPTSVSSQELIINLRRENAILRKEKAVLATRVVDFCNFARREHERAEEQARKAERLEKHLQAVQGRASTLKGKADVLPFRDSD